MRILVTGAGGFVGPHLMRELRAAGYDPIGVDRTGSSGVKIADLSQHDEVEALLEHQHPDAIVHLAGWSHVGRSWEMPAKVFQANLLCSILLYEVFAKWAGSGARFLYISSSDVYGKGPPERLPLTESTPTNPESPYAVSKLAAEQTLRLLRQRGGPDLMIARPFNHIGPGQSASFACPAFARQIVDIESGRREALRHGNLQSKRDFIDVRDAVRAYRLMLESGRDGDMFVVASGASHSMESIVKELFSIAGIEPKMKLDEHLLRPIDTPELRGSAKHLHERTKWSPKITLRESLTAVLEEARGAFGNVPA
ncbi:GDP-6-deoxy-D-mannose reductase [soil metagenome]